MSTPEETKQILSKHNIIPDVLPEQTTLSYTLTLQWPDATLDTPGTLIDRESTLSQPIIQLHPPPTTPLKNLILICTDPDLLTNHDTYAGQVRHWLSTHISAHQNDSSLDFSHAQHISPWLPPAPLPNYISARPHRYVFVLARPRDDGDEAQAGVSQEDLRAVQSEGGSLVGGGTQGEEQDLMDRWGFDVWKLVERKGWKVEGVNFMRVSGTVKSGVENLGLMGEGVVNKVSS